MNKEIIIVGAGISGLTAAYILQSSGFSVTVIEKNNFLGGLAGGKKIDDFTFDFGPHRFHTDDQRILDLLKDIDPYMLEIDRNSMVYIFDKYLDWPIQPKTICALPYKVLLSAGLDLFKVLKKKPPSLSFEDYIINLYGHTLYRHFFKEYTEKFLELPAKNTHRDWAKTGIDRAVIDKKLNMDNIWQLAFITMKRLYDRDIFATKFLYPKDGMMGFIEKFSSKIVEKGGQIITNCEIKPKIVGNILELGDGLGNSNDKIIIWTGSILTLAKALNLNSTLQNRSLILYFIQLKSRLVHNFQWCYFGQKSVPFCRLSTPSSFSSDLIPFEKDSLCAELTCWTHDEIWKNPQLKNQEIIDALEATGIIPSGHIDSITSLHLMDAYPVYSMGYKEHLKNIVNKCDGLKNTFMAGRNGKFWYANMDHVIADSMDICERIIDKYS